MKQFILLFAICFYLSFNTLAQYTFIPDTSFHSYTNNNIDNVNAFVKQGNKLVMGGLFTRVAGIECSNICRLKNDSTADMTFQSGSGFNGEVKKIIVLPSNKLLVMGDFTTYGQTYSNYLIRLNADGSPDNTFLPNFDAGSNLFDFAVQADGKIIVIGLFNTYSGYAKKNLVRLLANGNLDMSFNSGDANNGHFIKVSLQSTGKIILTGIFNAHNGTAATSIVRLTSTGSVDNTFNNDPLPLNAFSTLGNVIVHPNDELTIQSINQFNYDGNPATYVVHTDAQGGFSNNYSTASLTTCILLANGNILNGGFWGYEIAREFTPAGTLVKSYTTKHYSYAVGDWHIKPIFEIDNRLYFNYDYTENPISTVVRFFRLKNDNDMDETFLPKDGPNYSITEMVSYSPGAYIISGGFTRVGSKLANSIAMIDNKGKLISSFQSGTGFNNAPLCMAVQADGKILVGGAFTTYNNQPVNHIVRLLPNGTIDPSFPTGSGTDFPVYDISIINTDKILLAGVFSDYNGTETSNIICLNPDGSIYTAFDPGVGTNGRIRKIYTKGTAIYLIGDFNYYNGIFRKHLVKLNTLGTIDLTFNPGQGDNGLLNDITITDQGNIYVTGQFDQYAGSAIGGLVKLKADGSVDSGFTGDFPRGYNIVPLNEYIIQSLCLYNFGGYQLFELHSIVELNMTAEYLSSGGISPFSPDQDTTDYYLKHYKLLRDGDGFFAYGPLANQAMYDGSNFIVKYKKQTNITTPTASSNSTGSSNLTYTIVQRELTIHDLNNSSGTLHIYDLNGKKIYTEAYQMNTGLPVQELSRGMYIIKFESDQNTIFTLKVLID